MEYWFSRGIPLLHYSDPPLVHFREPDRPAKNPHRHLRMDIRRLGRHFLSSGATPNALAGFLCALLSRSRSGFHFLCRAERRNIAPMDRAHTDKFPFYLQVAARNLAYAPTARLHRRTERISKCDRTARAKIVDHPDPVAALLRAERWPPILAQICVAGAKGLPVRD